MSLVGLGMSSNPIRSHFLLTYPGIIKVYDLLSSLLSEEIFVQLQYNPRNKDTRNMVAYLFVQFSWPGVNETTFSGLPVIIQM